MTWTWSQTFGRHCRQTESFILQGNHECLKLDSLSKKIWPMTYTYFSRDSSLTGHPKTASFSVPQIPGISLTWLWQESAHENVMNLVTLTPAGCLCNHHHTDAWNHPNCPPSPRPAITTTTRRMTATERKTEMKARIRAAEGARRSGIRSQTEIRSERSAVGTGTGTWATTTVISWTGKWPRRPTTRSAAPALAVVRMKKTHTPQRSFRLRGRGATIRPPRASLCLAGKCTCELQAALEPRDDPQ